MRIAIYGAGGFGREVLYQAQRAFPGAEFFFADDALAGSAVAGVLVVSVAEAAQADGALIAVQGGATRQKMAENCRRVGLPVLTMIAATAIVSPHVTIGEGAVLCEHAMLTGDAVIGRQFQCNIYSYVAHDCRVGDHVTFAPRVSCNGNVRIEDHVYVGTGAVIRNGTPERPIVIGKGATIGMGAVVTKSVAAGETVVGNPAKPMPRPHARASHIPGVPELTHTV